MALSIHKELNQVVFEEKLGVRKVLLNRPKTLNCLNYEMIDKMLNKLQAYENDPRVKLVILKNKNPYVIYESGHWSFGASFNRKILTLVYLLATYKKPLVPILNGIVMGGGAGLSMHAKFRIVTEQTVFAMPEAAIGLFPDVGAPYFLSRLPGFFEYAGLTGTRLDGSEMLACGLATHFVHSKDLASLENELESMSSRCALDVPTISQVINKFACEVPIKQDSAYNRLEIVNSCFSRETVEEIISSLEKLARKGERWIVEAINDMKAASPTSLKIFLRMIREGRMQRLKGCLLCEYNVTVHILQRTINDDFFEGSRAMIIEKDKKPRLLESILFLINSVQCIDQFYSNFQYKNWNPSKLEVVTDEMVGQFFDKAEDDEWAALDLPSRSESLCILQPRL
ncbi:3-hydroxyisobutyryl-CoA hydrolase [Bertholletia excelsa]